MSTDAPSAVPTGPTRRAWSPEVDDEIGAVLRRLCRRPWLFSGRDDPEIAAVRRNQAALRDVFARVGWVLVVERDLVRLRKSPPGRRDAWAADGPSPRACSWFFLLVAAAESMPPKVGLGQLVAAARAAAAEAGVASTGDIAERRAVVTALRLLENRGLVEPLDGDVDGFVRDEDAPVLLAVHHTRLVHVIANFAVGDPVADPAAWLADVEHEADPARRMRRRLVDDTVVHACDLDDSETDWLSRRVRGDDGGPLAQAFGLHLERRAEGAAFVVSDEVFRYPQELGPLPFPVPGTVGHAALLLCDHAGHSGTLVDSPGVGWRGLTGIDVVSRLAELASRHAVGHGGWRHELAEDPEALAGEVLGLLSGLSLVRVGNDPDWTWWFSPATGRWSTPSAGTATTTIGTTVPPEPATTPSAWSAPTRTVRAASTAGTVSAKPDVGPDAGPALFGPDEA